MIEMTDITALLFEGYGPNCPQSEDLPDMKKFTKMVQVEEEEGVFFINLLMKDCHEVDDFFQVIFQDSSMMKMKVEGSITGTVVSTIFIKNVLKDGMNNVLFRCLDGKPEFYLTNIGFLDENLITYEE